MLAISLTRQVIELISWHSECSRDCRDGEHAETIWLGTPPDQPMTEDELIAGARANLAIQYGVEMVAIEAVEEIMPYYAPGDDRALYTAEVTFGAGKFRNHEVEGRHPGDEGVAYQSYRVRFRTDLPVAALQEFARRMCG